VDPFVPEVRLKIDPSSEVLLPPGGDARKLYERSRLMLGGEDPIVVALGFEDAFARESLERVLVLSEALNQVEGVSRVLSLATAMSVRSVEGDVEVAPFLEELPADDASREAIAREVLANPLYRGILASEDRTTTALFVYLVPMTDMEFVRAGIDGQIAEIARAEAGRADVWISGFPHFKAAMSATLQRDLAVVLPIIVLILAGALGLAFRSPRGVFVPLATIAVSLLSTLAMVVALGASLNVVTVIVPPLILTLGFAYTMHVMFDYMHQLRARDPKQPRSPQDVVRAALHEVGTPVLVSGVTTAAGFIALSISQIPGVREFGIFSLLGVVITVILSLSFTPALLALLPLPDHTAGETSGGVLDRLAERMAGLAVRHRRVVIGGAFVILAVSAWGATQIVVASHFITAFREDAPVRQEFEAINQRLGGANAIQVLVEADERQELLEPAKLQALREFQDWLESQEEIGRVTGIVDYLMLLNQAFHDGDEAYYAVPASKNLASQLLWLGGSQESNRMLDAGGRVANITALSTVGDSGAVGDLVSRIEGRLEALPGDLESAVTGNMVLVSHSVNAVARGQLTSLLLAFAIIYLVLALLFTSLRVGLVALLPNVLPIATYFGALGFTGITLNTSTALVGCLALGIAVDDTIHYFARFNREARRLGDELQATRSTLRSLIHPVTFTSAGLCLGFFMLTTTALRPQAEFGILAAFTLAVAWVLDVSLSPALCSGLRVVTLWDLVSLDLGEDPQHSIPLFRDLSPRQARVFTLLSEVRELEADEVLLRLGDPGQDVFVVLDGSLVAWIERGGRRVELSRMTRGDTIGEIGHFSRGRTANVDALTDVRLIRFAPEDLDRMCRRRPRIAAMVYRNLNRIQASRLVRTTERLS